MLSKPGHLLWPGTRVLKTGKNRRTATLEGINEHERDGIIVELVTRWTIVLDPETNKGNQKSKPIIELVVGLHQPRVGRTQSEQKKMMSAIRILMWQKQQLTSC